MVYRRNSGRNSDSSRDSSRDSASSGAGTYGTNATVCDEDMFAQYTPEDRKKIAQVRILGIDFNFEMLFDEIFNQ